MSEYQIVRKGRGNNYVDEEGYCFVLERKTQSKIYLRCANKFCTSKAIIEEDVMTTTVNSTIYILTPAQLWDEKFRAE